MPDLARLSCKKMPALHIALPGGAVLTRPAGQKNGPVRCERCGAESGPAGVETLEEFYAWRAKHEGETCKP